MYPKSFDWKHVLTQSGNQGNCGSCYIFSTLRMTEARLRILYNHDIKLSVQHAVDCSYYNQGCDGGYPYLVMKFSNENQLIPEDCHNYYGRNDRCSASCNINELKYHYKIKDYKYIGGSYGKCSEKGLMEEIFKKGPVVVSFEPDYNFMFYKKGVYHSLSENTWMDKGLMKPEWEKVDHSVLVVGWGNDYF